MDFSDESQFSYVQSAQLPMSMRIKINSLGKSRSPPTALQIMQNPILQFSPWAHPTKAADLFVRCRVSAAGRHVIELFIKINSVSSVCMINNLKLLYNFCQVNKINFLIINYINNCFFLM